MFLANDLLTQKQVACKIVDLGKKAAEPNEQDKHIDEAHTFEVQAFAEQEKNVTAVREKLLREIEVLSKLSHVSKDLFRL